MLKNFSPAFTVQAIGNISGICSSYNRGHNEGIRGGWDMANANSWGVGGWS